LLTEAPLELLKCYYNFVRPHMVLKFGREVRTPAMQAGFVGRKLTFRDIFTAVAEFLRLTALVIRVGCWCQGFIPRLAAAR
jgi:hypothetical protein